MIMKNGKQVLTSALKTTQMGQIGIRSVLDTSMSDALRKALESQLAEYDAIEADARTLAVQRGWELPELDPAVRAMANMVTRMRLGGRDTDSKIADMMIRGNTNGLVKGLKHLHRMEKSDSSISSLSQKLLDTETANIRQMESFL